MAEALGVRQEGLALGSLYGKKGHSRKKLKGPERMESNNPFRGEELQGKNSPLFLKRHQVSICLSAGLVATIAILWLIGIHLWTVVAIALFIACPLVVASVLWIERNQNQSQKSGRK
ncbi:hypothetical protein ACFOW6_11490 [Fodinicurvata halophila]|uniref:Uncharacterized protein n=1 Tax=Fodinicurvata halophila TaxID=1419723 RepID=A0ABV8ULK2_9PROT